MTLLSRFLDKVSPEPNTGCWLWHGSCDGKGYGRIAYEGRSFPAHRASHILFKGPIPNGLQIDHLCRQPGCVNPEHIEAVTARVNNMRGDSVAVKASKATHCPQGHPYSGDNLGRRTTRNERFCKTCKRQQDKDYYYRRK